MSKHLSAASSIVVLTLMMELVECVAVRYAFRRFTQGLPSYQQVGYQIDQQQLPGGQVAFFLYEDSRNEQDDGQDYKKQLFLQAAFFMPMLVLMLMPVVIMFVCHILFLLLSVDKGRRRNPQPGCKQLTAAVAAAVTGELYELECQT